MIRSVIFAQMIAAASILASSSPVLAKYDKDIQQKLLDKNKLKWDAFIGSPDRSYTMKFSKSCFCPPEYRGPFDVVVESGVVVSATYSADSDMPAGEPVGENGMSVIQTPYVAFDEIQRALDEEAADLIVTYDDEAGYPASIYIDWEEMMADEETSLSFDNIVLQPDPTKVVTGAPTKAPSSAPTTAAPVAMVDDADPPVSPTASPAITAPVTTAPVEVSPGSSDSSATPRPSTFDPASLEAVRSSSTRLGTSLLFSLLCVFVNGWM